MYARSRDYINFEEKERFKLIKYAVNNFEDLTTLLLYESKEKFQYWYWKVKLQHLFRNFEKYISAVYHTSIAVDIEPGD